jgi:site-specific DNA recombinase
MEALAKNVRVIPANPMLTPTGRPKSQKERVAAYCRVSTDEEDQKNSFLVQKEFYETKISQTPEWSLAGIFADEGITGTSMDRRTEFRKMLRHCRQRKIDRILCKSISRFARNTVDCLDTVRELKSLGIAVFFEKENIDTLLQQSEFIITLYSSFAQAESESISANVRLGKRMSFAQGKVIIRTDMMVGYEKDENGNPIIDPTGAATVLRIYSSYLAGMSLGQIRKELVEDGVPTARGVKAWSTEVIQSILKNERYTGDALLQKWYKEGCLTKNCKRNNGELPQYYVENNHEAIVSKELFNRVQSEMARRANRKKAVSPTGERIRGKYSAQYALTEKLICGECGTPYRRCTWTQNGVKRVVWRCISRLEYGKQYCHKSPTMDEYKLHEAIIQAINRILEDKDDILETVTAGIRAAFDNGKGGVTLSELRRRKAELREIISDLTDIVLGKNDITEEIHQRLQDSISELERSESAIKEMEREQAAEECENARLTAILEAIRETPCALNEYDDTLVRQIIERITVDSKEQITVSFGYGVDIPIAIS